jgi:hypothetical protein
VIAFELLAGFTLYFKKTRTPTMVLGTLFHLFNAIVLSIPGFLNCVTMYALFIDYRPRAARSGTVGAAGVDARLDREVKPTTEHAEAVSRGGTAVGPGPV